MGNKTYKVGYGKPPKSGQFQKGRSGNPKGRPPRGKTLRSIDDLHQIVLTEVNEDVTFKIDGIKVTMSAIQAAIKRLKAMALRGDRLAIKDLLKLAQTADARNKEQFEEMMTIVMKMSKNLETLSDEEFKEQFSLEKDAAYLLTSNILSELKRKASE